MHNIAKCSQHPWEWGTSWENRPYYLHGFQLKRSVGMSNRPCYMLRPSEA